MECQPRVFVAVAPMMSLQGVRLVIPQGGDFQTPGRCEEKRFELVDKDGRSGS